MNDGKVFVVNGLVGKILRVQRVGVQCTKDLNQGNLLQKKYFEFEVAKAVGHESL